LGECILLYAVLFNGFWRLPVSSGNYAKGVMDYLQGIAKEWYLLADAFGNVDLGETDEAMILLKSQILKYHKKLLIMTSSSKRGFRG
jgi:hypothetical protein